MRKQSFYMTRWNKIILMYLGLLMPMSVFSQNLFDENSILKFANFLYTTRQYSYASEEFERLVVMVPQNGEYQLKLVRSYRLGENYPLAKKRICDFANDSLFRLSGSLAPEYLKVNLLQEDLKGAQQYLNVNNRLETPTKLKYQEFIYLLSKDWVKADTFNKTNHILDRRYDQLFIDYKKMHYKSPFLSGALSTAIPGMGKVYAGYWKDGIISFLFVSVNAWQSYRGFSKNGVNSTYGWVFGTFATGFYLGNIYGSIKAAIKHNNTANNKIYDRAKVYIYSDIQ